MQLLARPFRNARGATMSSGKAGRDAVRTPAALESLVGVFRAQHLALGQKQVSTDRGNVSVLVDEAESPLAWLARRRGRNNRPLIEPHQLLAGERLRVDFTRANLLPRVTSNLENPASSRKRTGGNPGLNYTEAAIASRQRVNLALDAVGPEFSGLLLDICCFLKSLDDVERERRWPSRSAKVVLQLALDRLARHYGYAAQTSGASQGSLRVWHAERECNLDSA